MSYQDNITQLVSRQEVINFLHSDQSSTLNSDAIDFYLSAATDQALIYCKRNLAMKKYTRTLDGLGENQIFVPDYPLLYVHTLEVDSDREFGDNTTLSNADITWERYGKIEYHDGFITKGRKNVRITYTAGYLLDGFYPSYTGLSTTVNSTSTDTVFDDIGTSRKDGLNGNENLYDYISTTIKNDQSLIDVRFDRIDKKYILQANSANTFEVDVDNSTAAWHLGFVSDKIGATEYESDFELCPLPRDLRQSIVVQTAWWYKQSWAQGDGMLGMKSRSIGGNVSEILADPILKILPSVKMIWDRYKKVNI